MTRADKRKYSQSARDDILVAAEELFYERGFGATDMKSVLERSGSHKASFYQHFGTLETLGLEYLRRKERLVLGRLRELTQASPDVSSFVAAWCAQVRKSIKAGTFRGCEFSNFAAQTLDRPECLAETRRITRSWLKLLEKYLAGRKRAGATAPDFDPRRAARRMLAYYEGAAQMLMLTGDLAFLDDFQQDCLRIPGLVQKSPK
jgi:AcrR family transcriptional regulator